MQGDSRAETGTQLVALLHPDALQLIAREDAEIEHFSDLRGKRVALASPGSGQYRTFWSVAAHYGLVEGDLEAISLSGDAAAFALVNGNVDATFRVRAPGNPAIARLVNRAPIHLIPINQAGAMRLREPTIEAGVIPRGSYQGFPPQPPEDLPTVQVRRLLLAQENVDPEVIYQLSRLLFERRKVLLALTPVAGFIGAPDRSTGTFFPIHEGAANYYNREKPGVLDRYGTIIALLTSSFAVMGSGLLSLNRRRKKQRIDEYNGELLDIADRVEFVTTLDELRACRRDASELATRVIRAIDRGVIGTHGFEFFSFAYRMADTAIRDRELELSADTSVRQA